MDRAADARPLDPSITPAARSDLSSEKLARFGGPLFAISPSPLLFVRGTPFSKKVRFNSQGRRNQSKGIVTERTATSDATRTDVSIMNTTICLVDISGKSDFMILPQLKYYSIIDYSIIKLHE
ncbi:hypothetical protein [Rhizobium sp. CF142]|uniref:hypothetical protein n=1 Tax=Rhizobium sp. CF142 TaxID=1144314 RepID=UPI0012F62EBB|nr:hypothetical protein [Rhizobium sp. CF142]